MIMETIDSLQIGKSLELFPDQIRNSFNEAYSANIAEFSPQAVVISGMGGSSNAAKILEGIYENDLKPESILIFITIMDCRFG